MDGPDGPSWRREDVDMNLQQTNEDQEARAKNPRNFGQEQRRGHQNDKGTRLKENSTTGGGPRLNDAKEDNPLSDIRERNQRSRTGPDFRHNDHQNRHAETKRRQGPIKPPKPPTQAEASLEREAGIQDDTAHGRASQDPASRAGRGSGRHPPLQARGGRRTHHQNHRQGQRNWDKMPESKETQTGN